MHVSSYTTPPEYLIQTRHRRENRIAPIALLTTAILATRVHEWTGWTERDFGQQNKASSNRVLLHRVILSKCTTEPILKDIFWSNTGRFCFRQTSEFRTDRFLVSLKTRKTFYFIRLQVTITVVRT